jgi:hypothetical protein
VNGYSVFELILEKISQFLALRHDGSGALKSGKLIEPVRSPRVGDTSASPKNAAADSSPGATTDSTPGATADAGE